MIIQFYKYQGTGNDFIMIDGMKDNSIIEYLDQEKISHLCHRRFGIGADGLIILSPDADSDFNMVYYNSDGRISSMCGNGSRCTVRFAHHFGYIGQECKFRAIDGMHDGKVLEDRVSVLMSDVHSVDQKERDYILNTGSPHYIHFLDDVDGIDIIEEAHKIRYSDIYKNEGINVNFVHANEAHINVRTYERGVEDETYSCGTGVVASAIDHRINDPNRNHEVDIHTKGRQLKVSFEKIDNSYKNIWLNGPAERAFEGRIEI